MNCPEQKRFHDPAERILPTLPKLAIGFYLTKTGIVNTTLSPRDENVGLAYDIGNNLEILGPGEVVYPVSWNTLTDTQKEFQNEKMAIYSAMIDCVDQEVGRLLEELKKNDMFDNTIIFVLWTRPEINYTSVTFYRFNDTIILACNILNYRAIVKVISGHVLSNERLVCHTTAQLRVCKSLCGFFPALLPLVGVEYATPRCGSPVVIANRVRANFLGLRVSRPPWVGRRLACSSLLHWLSGGRDVRKPKYGRDARAPKIAHSP